MRLNIIYRFWQYHLFFIPKYQQFVTRHKNGSLTIQTVFLVNILVAVWINSIDDKNEKVYSPYTLVDGDYKIHGYSFEILRDMIFGQMICLDFYEPFIFIMHYQPQKWLRADFKHSLGLNNKISLFKVLWRTFTISLIEGSFVSHSLLIMIFK